MKILIIDDEPHIIRALSLLLERAGYEVLSARNGADGLAKLHAECPDIAIIDMMMPRVTGLELLGLWNDQKAATEDTQFIMLTASCDEEIKDGIEKFDHVKLVAKPFSPRHILNVVEDVATRTTGQI